MKLLKEIYKTYDGALKRARFENGLAAGEYQRGDKARLYHYEIFPEPTTDSEPREPRWRVKREVFRCSAT